jgi:hypothetical protein
VTMSHFEEHDDVWHANLTQQDVLAGLGHWAVSGGTHQMAPSIWAAPVIMFSHSQRGLGSPRGRSDGFPSRTQRGRC